MCLHLNSERFIGQRAASHCWEHWFSAFSGEEILQRSVETDFCCALQASAPEELQNLEPLTEEREVILYKNKKTALGETACYKIL